MNGDRSSAKSGVSGEFVYCPIIREIVQAYSRETIRHLETDPLLSMTETVRHTHDSTHHFVADLHGYGYGGNSGFDQYLLRIGKPQGTRVVRMNEKRASVLSGHQLGHIMHP